MPAMQVRRAWSPDQGAHWRPDQRLHSPARGCAGAQCVVSYILTSSGIACIRAGFAMHTQSEMASGMTVRHLSLAWDHLLLVVVAVKTVWLWRGAMFQRDSGVTDVLVPEGTQDDWTWYGDH